MTVAYELLKSTLIDELEIAHDAFAAIEIVPAAPTLATITEGALASAIGDQITHNAAVDGLPALRVIIRDRLRAVYEIVRQGYALEIAVARATPSTAPAATAPFNAPSTVQTSIPAPLFKLPVETPTTAAQCSAALTFLGVE